MIPIGADIKIDNDKVEIIGKILNWENWYIHNKHSTIKSVYYVVVSYTQTDKKQLFIINEHITLSAYAF